jgi:hypothetical protein
MMLPIVGRVTMNTLAALSLENTTKVTKNIIRPKSNDFALTAKRVARAAGI